MQLQFNTSFPVPLGYTAHQLAEKFAKQQTQSVKAQQVYLNTLAVHAVTTYLKCMGIEADWSASDSWDLVSQTLMDIADLEIPNIGKLECRPVLAPERFVQIPPEVWAERIGYVAVQLNDSLSSGLLVGFTKTALIEQLPLNQLSSISGLLEHLNQIRQTKMQVELEQWFENNFTSGWQLAKVLFSNQSARGLSSVRSGEPFLVDKSNSMGSISAGRLIDLGIQIYQHPLALIVTVRPITDKERNILVQVKPNRGRGILPQGVGLIVSDPSGTISKDTISRAEDNCIQLEFFASVGEQFSAKVTFDDASLTQNFLV